MTIAEIWGTERIATSRYGTPLVMSNCILSRPCSYAIRALAYLAQQPPGRISSSREVCDQEDIPPAYLGKVLLPLCRCRILHSLRGIGGGYQLAVPPDQIPLLSIVEAIDGSQLDPCVLEDRPCGNPRKCLLHDVWADIRGQFIDYLRRTTVADLARDRKSARIPLSIESDAAEVSPSTR